MIWLAHLAWPFVILWLLVFVGIPAMFAKGPFDRPLEVIEP